MFAWISIRGLTTAAVLVVDDDDEPAAIGIKALSMLFICESLNRRLLQFKAMPDAGDKSDDPAAAAAVHLHGAMAVAGGQTGAAAASAKAAVQLSNNRQQ